LENRDTCQFVTGLRSSAGSNRRRGEPGEKIGACPRFRCSTEPGLSPLDLIVAPNGNLLVASEHPFGAPDAVTTVREYDPETGRLVRVFSASGLAEFRKPRGLRFGADGYLYCVAQDEVVAFDLTSGRCLGAIVRWARLFGQALAFFPP
jgi:DNA-binding beta-propeller fold protein YncE